jgi:hypothetical protein
MSNSRVNLRDPWVAAVLSWLVPGAGHFYQGRLFKSGLYFVCILGTFFFGQHLADGKAVHWHWQKDRKTYGYLAQVLVGIPALPGLIQSYRLPISRSGDDSYNNRSRNRLDSPLDGPFEGFLSNGRNEGVLHVEGRIHVEPQAHEEYYTPVKGRFSGIVEGLEGPVDGLKEGAKVEVELTSLESIEPAIYPSPDRELACRAQGRIGDPPAEWAGTLSGSVLGVRSFIDRYEAPLDDIGLQDANGDLGKYFELGLVFTWIAGLLNILVIWDAFEGPAYGYGDETGEEKNSDAKPKSTAAVTPQAAPSPAETVVASPPGATSPSLPASKPPK